MLLCLLYILLFAIAGYHCIVDAEIIMECRYGLLHCLENPSLHCTHCNLVPAHFERIAAVQVARYLTPCMLEKAAASSIELVLIDPTQDIEQQGRFDAIIHKLRPNEGVLQ